MCLLVASPTSKNNTAMAADAMPPFSSSSLGYVQDIGFLLLLLSGDVETNPGPATGGRRSVAQGPSTEEQVYTLNTQASYIS